MLAVCGLSLSAIRSQADVKMPEVFADHMVLQRNAEVNIFGKANSGEKITVSFAGKNVSTVTGQDGQWLLKLPKMKASAKGRELKVTGNSTIIFKDVLVGEVWHANGQSNMEWALKRIGSYGKEVMAKADNKQIRFFHCLRKLSPKGVYKGKQLELSKNKDIYTVHGWMVSSQKTAPQFSAVAYIFAQAMQRELNVPVGILSTGAGGSPTEAFISLGTLMSHPRTAKMVKGWPYSKECNTKQAAKCFKNVLKKGEKIKFGEFPYHHPWEPGILFETGIKPMLPYTINGAIWYQGETNQNNPDFHNMLFPMMVRDWRKNWGLGNFPVYYVQLPSVNRKTWPVFRDGQRKFVTAEPNMGMAVTIDTGDVKRKANVHPVDKIEVGERLAYLAIENAIKKNKVLATGPLVTGASVKSDKVIVEFDYNSGLKSSDGNELNHFEVAGPDGKYVPAEAQIKNGTIVLTSTVKRPKKVRYAWHPFPMPRPNFSNDKGHIASPFEINIK